MIKNKNLFFATEAQGAQRYSGIKPMALSVSPWFDPCFLTADE